MVELGLVALLKVSGGLFYPSFTSFHAQEYGAITAAENILFAKPSHNWRKCLK